MLKVMILLGLAICSFGFFAEAMLDEPNNAPGEPPASTNTNQLPVGQAGLLVRNSNGLAKLRLLGQPNNVPAPEEPPASTNTNHPPAGQAGLIVRNPLNSAARRRLFGAPDSPIRVGNGPPLDKEGTELDPIPMTNFASRRMLSPRVRTPASPGRSPLRRKSGDHNGKGHHRGFDQLVEEEGASANAEVHQSILDHMETPEVEMTLHYADHGDSPVSSPLSNNADDQREQKRLADAEKVVPKVEEPEHFRDHPPVFERERHQSPAGSHRNVQQQGMLPTSLPHSPTAHRHMLPVGWQQYFSGEEAKVSEDKVAGKQTSMNDQGERSLEGSSIHANSIRSKADGQQQQRQHPAAGSDIAGSDIAVVEKPQFGEGKNVKAEKEGGIEAANEREANEREQRDKLEDTLDGM